MLPFESLFLYKMLYKNINRVFSNNTKILQSFINIRASSTENDGQYKGNYDVIIAGGGMVGCTLACAMSKDSLLSKLKILLLESSPNTKFQLKPVYSNRVVALSQKTKSLMNDLDVWKHVEAMRLKPVRHMQVWDASSDAIITFSSSDILDDDVAYIVENNVLQHAINTELNNSNNEGLNIIYGAKIAEYTLPNSTDRNIKSMVKLSDGDTFSCKLLIGADGANSAVRRAMGVQYVSWNYDQMGVVATLQLAEETENSTAWQRWLPSGPVALLPLDSTHSSLVWSNWNDNAKRLLEMSEELFVDALNDALWKQYPRSSGVDACLSWFSSCLRRAGLPDGAVRQLPPSVKAIVPSSRAAFPLGFGHSTRYVAPGVALIGDAAHRVHPLAGQGVNLGFGDVKELVQLLSNAIYTGLDIVHPDWMEKYESERQKHNVPTQLGIDALYRLYSVDLPPVVLVRSLGVQFANAMQPLKKMIMARAAT